MGRNGTENMSCEYNTKEYVEYLTGELEESLRASLDAHIPHCPRCRAELEAYSRVLQGLSALPDMEPPAGLTDSILGRLFPRPSVLRRQHQRSVAKKVATVLGAQALLVSFLFAIQGLAGRAVIAAWETVKDGAVGLVDLGHGALVVITSLSRVLKAAGDLFETIAGAVDPGVLVKALVPSDAAFLIVLFTLLTTALLWRLVGHALPRAEREVHNVR